MKHLTPILLAGALLAAPAQAEGTLDTASYVAWHRCLDQTADALALQPESVSTIVTGVFGACWTEEKVAVARSYGWTRPVEELMDEYKRTEAVEFITGRILARRAAHEAVTHPVARQQPRYLQQ